MATQSALYKEKLEEALEAIEAGEPAWRVSGWFEGKHYNCFGRGSTALKALRDM